MTMPRTTGVSAKIGAAAPSAAAQHEHHYAHNVYWQLIDGALRRWIADLGLERGRVLEIGCGLGLMQDLVDDYVGIDIARYPARHMRKPFAICSGTRLPFPDDSFDAIWSIWVMEHVDRPEEMLEEIRRVLKPGGHVFLVVGFAVDSWVAQGLHVRPFGELSPRQRVIKSTIPLRASRPYKVAAALPGRLADLAAYALRRQPARLRYRRLQPNFERYWDYDADACSSLDSYNLALYFLSRGDEPYFRDGAVRSLLRRSQPQAFTLRKGGAPIGAGPRRAWSW